MGKKIIKIITMFSSLLVPFTCFILGWNYYMDWIEKYAQVSDLMLPQIANIEAMPFRGLFILGLISLITAFLYFILIREDDD
jgi:hypothetical protein